MPKKSGVPFSAIAAWTILRTNICNVLEDTAYGFWQPDLEWTKTQLRLTEINYDHAKQDF